MSVTQQQVLDSLARIKSPRGVALTNANVLSAISAADGKVFFSINVSMPPKREPGNPSGPRPRPRCAPFPASPPSWWR
ncbi:hypothetical protein ACVWZL_002498 [Bradyrhizobium sp. GM2.4]